MSQMLSQVVQDSSEIEDKPLPELPTPSALGPIVSPDVSELSMLFRRLARLRRRFEARHGIKQHESTPQLETSDVIPLSGAREVAVRELYGVRMTSQGLLFAQPHTGQQTIHVAGDFNDWNTQQHALNLNKAMGIWHLLIDIPPQRYCYRLLINGQWQQDDFNLYIEANPFGGLNNVIDPYPSHWPRTLEPTQH